MAEAQASIEEWSAIESAAWEARDLGLSPAECAQHTEALRRELAETHDQRVYNALCQLELKE